MTTNIPFQKERPIFRKVANISELVNMTEQELEIYNISLDSYRTNLSVMKNERKEGREEGRIEGRIEERFEIAKSMKSKNFPIEVIAEITQLPISEIEKL